MIISHTLTYKEARGTPLISECDIVRKDLADSLQICLHLVKDVRFDNRLYFSLFSLFLSVFCWHMSMVCPQSFSYHYFRIEIENCSGQHLNALVGFQTQEETVPDYIFSDLSVVILCALS